MEKHEEREGGKIILFRCENNSIKGLIKKIKKIMVFNLSRKTRLFTYDDTNLRPYTRPHLEETSYTYFGPKPYTLDARPPSL